MNSSYQYSKFLMEWQNAINEAIAQANMASDNRFFHIQPYSNCFINEDNTIYHGYKVNTLIKGRGVSFWIGMDITSRTASGNGEIILDFDSDSNSDEDIGFLKDQKASFTDFSQYKPTTEGFRLVLADKKINNAQTAEEKRKIIYDFFTSVINKLREHV